MTENLLPIYELRMQLLQELNPKFFAANATMIRRSSLAAQEYIMSGQYQEYDRRTGDMFKTLPGYINIHKKYKIPYNPNEKSPSLDMINPGLVMDLAWSLRKDIINGVVDSNGNIIKTSLLPQSSVLHIYHNSRNNGTPVNALKIIPSSKLENILLLLNKQNTKVH